MAAKGLKPDLTILLDVGPKKGLLRAGRKDRVELKSYGFHQRVRRGYLTLAKRQPKRIVLIRANGRIDDVQKKIRTAVLNVI